MARRTKPPSISPVRLPQLRYFEHLFRCAGVGASISDRDGVIFDANPALERLLGYGPGELVGRSIHELISPGRRPILLQQVLEAGGSWSGSVTNRRKRGSILPTRLQITAIRDESGDSVGLITFCEDDQPNQRRRARLASLSAVGAALNAEGDLTALLERICEEARALFGVDGAYVSRLDEQTQELVGMAGSGPYADRVRGERVRVANRDDALGRAVAEREPKIAHRVRPEGDYADRIEEFGVRSSLLAPLVRGERVLGILALNDARHDERFGAEDAALAGAFAELAAVAIEGARLHAAERHTNERLEALAQVNRMLAASLEQEEVFRAIADGARRLLAVDEVAIWLLEEPAGPFRLAHFASTTGQEPSRQLDWERSLLASVVRTGRPWQRPDLAADPEHPLDYDRPIAAIERGIRGYLLVPLIARDRPLGGIGLFSRSVRDFDDEEVDLVQAFANQAALAVRNAEILARERRGIPFQHLLQRSKALSRRDRQVVEHLLEAAERIVELAEGGA